MTIIGEMISVAMSVANPSAIPSIENNAFTDFVKSMVAENTASADNGIN